MKAVYESDLVTEKIETGLLAKAFGENITVLQKEKCFHFTHTESVTVTLSVCGRLWLFDVCLS